MSGDPTEVQRRQGTGQKAHRKFTDSRQDAMQLGQQDCVSQTFPMFWGSAALNASSCKSKGRVPLAACTMGLDPAFLILCTICERVKVHVASSLKSTKRICGQK